MWRWVWWVLIIALMFLVIGNLVVVETLVRTLVGAQITWILAAVLAQVLYSVLLAGAYHYAYAAVNVESPGWRMVPLVVVASFINTVTYTGTAGAAIYLDDAARRDQSQAATTAGILLVQVVYFGVFALLLFAGLGYLVLYHQVMAYQIVASVLLVLLVLFYVSLFALSLWRPRLLLGILTRIQRVIVSLARRFRRSSPIGPTWAATTVSEFAAASRAIRERPWALIAVALAAFLAHGVHVLMIWIIFQAYEYPASFGVVFVGYTVGTLFWVITITPQGIGVVEGVMALVFTALGVLPTLGAVVALVFRGIAFWIPLLAGFLLLSRMPTFGSAERAQATSWHVRIPALFLMLLAVANLYLAVTPAVPDEVAVSLFVSPEGARHAGRLMLALTAYAMLLIGGSVWAAKRTALAPAFLVLGLSAVGNVLANVAIVAAVLAVGMALWLWLIRSRFHVQPDRPSIARGVEVLVLAVGYTLVYGIVGFYALRGEFSMDYGLGDALGRTMRMFTHMGNTGVQPTSDLARHYLSSIYVVFAATVSYSPLVFWSRLAVGRTGSKEERARARAIVEEHAWSSLACYALLNDKSYHFPGQDTVIAYVRKGVVALALGDPIGPRGGMRHAIDSFQDRCRSAGWIPAFYQVEPSHLSAYREGGFDLLPLGEEAIGHLDVLDLMDVPYQALRMKIRELTGRKYWAELHRPPLARTLLNELHYVNDEWLTMVGGDEKSFSLGWFADERLCAMSVMAVHRPDGGVDAFCTVLPERRFNGSLLDLLRWRPTSAEGVNDFLLVATLEWLIGEGCERLDLGFTSLKADREGVDGSRVVARAAQAIHDHLSGFYHIDLLHRLKAQLDPEWQLRYLAFPGPGTLPAVADALIRANSGDRHLWDPIADHLARLIRRWRGS